MHLSKQSILRLRERGLYVGDHPFYPKNHSAYPSGYIVIKPAQTPGNSVPDYDSLFDDSEGIEQVTDAPTVKLCFSNGAWKIQVHEYIPGPGPGDFTQEFLTEEEAIAGIFHYFFEDSPHFRELLAAQADEE